MVLDKIGPHLWQILTIQRILEDVNPKNLPATLLFVDFSKAYLTQQIAEE